jgi:ferredoxin
MVEKFLAKIDIPASTFIFAVATYGGFPAGALLLLHKVLQKKGRELSAGFGIHMPGNYTPMYGAKPERVQKDLFNKEKNAIDKIVQVVSSRAKTKIACNNPVINTLFSTLMFNAAKGQIYAMDTKYIVDPSCTHCGLCAKVCPANNIVMKNELPTWRHRCEQCMACLQWCPVEAIQYGPGTRGRKRYHHPDISMTDVIAQKG